MQLRDNESWKHGNRTANILLHNLPGGAAEQSRGKHCCSSLIRLRASSNAIKSPKMSTYSKEPIHIMLQELCIWNNLMCDLLSMCYSTAWSKQKEGKEKEGLCIVVPDGFFWNMRSEILHVVYAAVDYSEMGVPNRKWKVWEPTGPTQWHLFSLFTSEGLSLSTCRCSRQQWHSPGIDEGK